MRSLLDILKEVLEKLKALTTSTNKKTEINLLWTNPNPTSSFAAQKVSLDLSGYDMIEIVSYSRIGQDTNYNGYTSGKFLKGKAGNISNACFIGASIDYIYLMSRPFSSNNTGITFEKGSTLYTNSNSHTATVTSNSSIIPYQIYGIKLGGVVNHRFFRRWFGC